MWIVLSDDKKNFNSILLTLLLKYGWQSADKKNITTAFYLYFAKKRALPRLLTSTCYHYLEGTPSICGVTLSTLPRAWRALENPGVFLPLILSKLSGMRLQPIVAILRRVCETCCAG